MKFLDCEIKNYKWGKVGNESIIAQFCKEKTEDPNLNYAEWWFGTHQNGMSILKNEKLSLKFYLGRDLPFLFKILSVKTALSVQVHPSKEKAVLYNKEEPETYKDDNHKPEMCIAITKFVLLCGFRPFEDIVDDLAKFPEILVDILNLTDSKIREEMTTKQIFAKVFSFDSPKFPQILAKILSSSNLKQNFSDLVILLNRQYPNDIGVLAPFFLNKISLDPGEAIFIPNGTPHAYVQGDCYEAMACSDNVIRCGLTPKRKDLDRFVDCAEFSSGTEVLLIKPEIQNDFTTVYNSPENVGIEFFVEKMGSEKGENCLNCHENESILFVSEGKDLALKNDKNNERIIVNKGDILLIEQNEKIVAESNKNYELIRCCSNK
ncbi:hypothetical protein MHBO_002327 [Bonamia ostreae]|uniref:mannose-6-phosphate isomerase n=1 Tax=Bonamia ostreae TaxID=126728 RepID=A0ABV2ALX5_9EUKA